MPTSIRAWTWCITATSDNWNTISWSSPVPTSQIMLDVGAGLALPKGHPQAAPLHVDGNGDLVVGTEDGEVRFHKPIVYQPATESGPITKEQQQGAKGEHFVDGNYVFRRHQITFEVATYDKTRPLVIDPVLAYSTYLGGSSGRLWGRHRGGRLGNAYVTGNTFSSDFPTTAGAFQTLPARRGNGDAFVSKLNAAGSALIYSTYLGGSGAGRGDGIAVDARVTPMWRASPIPPTSPPPRGLPEHRLAASTMPLSAS